MLKAIRIVQYQRAMKLEFLKRKIDTLEPLTDGAWLKCLSHKILYGNYSAVLVGKKSKQTSLFDMPQFCTRRLGYQLSLLACYLAENLRNSFLYVERLCSCPQPRI